MENKIFDRKNQPLQQCTKILRNKPSKITSKFTQNHLKSLAHQINHIEQHINQSKNTYWVWYKQLSTNLMVLNTSNHCCVKKTTERLGRFTMRSLDGARITTCAYARQPVRHRRYAESGILATPQEFRDSPLQTVALLCRLKDTVGKCFALEFYFLFRKTLANLQLLIFIFFIRCSWKHL